MRTRIHEKKEPISTVDASKPLIFGEDKGEGNNHHPDIDSCDGFEGEGKGDGNIIIG
jgi:hypothetical protein